MSNKFLNLYKTNKSLSTNDKKELVSLFSDDLTFDEVFAKESVSPSDLVIILENYGNFWVTIDADPSNRRQPHAVVVCDISKDTKEKCIIKYFDVGDGEIKESNFTDFMLRVKNGSNDLKTAVIRLKKSINEGVYEIEGPFNFYNPIHENITKDSLIRAKIAMSYYKIWAKRTQKDFKTNEFLRGVFWNDDPEILLFDTDKNDNSNFSSGLEWSLNFKSGSKTSLTQRSHFGDLQFLHSMASKINEEAETTKGNILEWLKFCYSVAIQETDEASEGYELSNNKTIKAFFTDKKTAISLFDNSSDFIYLKIKNRAMGSLLHTIQDSFAKGHVKRDNSGKGNIITFHCYSGQNEKEHSKHDEEIDERTTAAENYCVEILKMWKEKTTLDDVYNYLNDTVFKLAPNVTKSDNKI